MSLRRELIATIAIQGAGAVSVAAAVFLLAATQGPEIQGVFNRTRTEVLLVSSVALLGLPQALFYYLKIGNLSLSSAYWFSRVAVYLAVVCALIYATFIHPRAQLSTLMFVFAVATCASHSNLRVLVLANFESVVFNIITAVPQFCLLAAVVIFVLLNQVGEIALTLTIAFSFLLGLLPAALMLINYRDKPKSGTFSEASNVKIFKYGAASWITAIAANSSALLVLKLVEDSVGARELGIFSMAMFAVQFILTPFDYASPILFKRWIGQPVEKVLWPIVIGLIMGALFLAAFLELVIANTKLFNLLGAYAPIQTIAVSIVVGSAAELVIRVFSVIYYSQGKPWLATASQCIRLFLIVVFAIVLPSLSLQSAADLWRNSALISAVLIVAFHALSLRAKGAVK